MTALKVLAGANLILTGLLLTLVNTTRLTELQDAFVYRAETVDLTFRLEQCKTSHRGLLTTIKKENLWKRLGLEGQPWLQ